MTVDWMWEYVKGVIIANGFEVLWVEYLRFWMVDFRRVEYEVSLAVRIISVNVMFEDSL